jgi:membrane protease YdiL (CAAX protease family)
MQETDVPKVALPFIVFSMGILGLLILSARFWLQGLMLWVAGRPVFPKPESRSMQRWGFVDLAFAFALVVGLQLAAAYSARLLHIGPRPGPDGEMGLMLVTWVSAIQTLAVGLTTVFIAQRCNIATSSIGWSIARLFYDLRLGVKAFIIMAPPVYLLMIIVTWLSGREYEHPIHKMASDDPWMLLPAIFMAVILAPLGEEFAFRVLLQGFLESLSVGRFSLEKFFVGRAFDSGSQLPLAVESQPIDSEFDVIQNPRPDAILNPYEASNALDSQASSPIEPAYLGTSSGDPFGSSEDVANSPRLPWWPMVVSGLLFGLAHFEYGMSWIPLSVLGIALGWLYRITNRIWPSLVVHFCINATSMIGFSLSVLFGDPTEGMSK